MSRYYCFVPKCNWATMEDTGHLVQHLDFTHDKLGCIPHEGWSKDPHPPMMAPKDGTIVGMPERIVERAHEDGAMYIIMRGDTLLAYHQDYDALVAEINQWLDPAVWGYNMRTGWVINLWR